MARVLSVNIENFPIAGTFTISRGSKTQAEVVTVTISDNENCGRGECVPYRRYGETIEGVVEAVNACKNQIEGGLGRQDLMSILPAGAARNAVDCALWDLEAKLSGRSAWMSLSHTSPKALETAYTLSLGTPDAMAAQARANAARPLLKVKIGGGDGDVERIRAVVHAAPASRFILDANEGWTEDNIRQNLAVAAECGIALVEQPLAAGQDGILRHIPHPIPICADESVHEASDLDQLVGLYDAVNIKLDKAGGLTAAALLRDRAQELGFSIMVGCMVGTSLAMAPAIFLAQNADFVDLDGPLLLARDRSPGLHYDGSQVFPPDSELWG